MNTEKNKHDALDGDPVSGTGEKHSTATNVGIAAGAVTGGVLGSALGPLGTVTGSILGAAAGGIAGLGIAESLDPTSEERYWESHFRDEPYYESERSFEDYGPAYRMGWEHYVPGKSFESSETVLMDIWSQEKISSHFPWERARHAAKASWDRVERRNRESGPGPDRS